MTDSQRPSDYPAWLRTVARVLYRLAGWRVEGTVPNLPKMLVIGAPHTSNWDGLHMLALSTSMGIRMYWLGKHTLFKPPFGGIMRAVNGVPINRQATKNGVDQVVDLFKQRERFVLIMAPEGTRKKTDYWKTGFYYIAQGAHVPIVLAYVDAPHRRVGLGPVVMPSGDIEADFEIFRAFYADKEGHHRDKKGTVGLPPQEQRRINRASKSEES